MCLRNSKWPQLLNVHKVPFRRYWAAFFGGGLWWTPGNEQTVKWRLLSKMADFGHFSGLASWIFLSVQKKEKKKLRWCHSVSLWLVFTVCKWKPNAVLRVFQCCQSRATWSVLPACALSKVLQSWLPSNCHALSRSGEHERRRRRRPVQSGDCRLSSSGSLD